MYRRRMVRGRNVGAWSIALCFILGACSSSRSSTGTAPLSTTGGAVGSPTASTDTTPAVSSAATDAPSESSGPTEASDPTESSTVAATEPTDTSATETPATDASVPDTSGTDTSGTDTSAAGTTSTSATPTFDSLVEVVPNGPCAFTPPAPMGEVTWVRDGQLRALADDADPTCLLDNQAGTAPMAWSSDAGRVLTDPTSATSASGTRSTGFGATNTSVTLSAPTGTATIGVDPATHRLIRQGPEGISDISFLARTDAAIYHPNGKCIIAVGTADNGAYGIWLSSNLGKEPKQILSVADPSTPVTDLAFSADATSLYFIHGFVHRLDFSGLILVPIGDEAHKDVNHEANLVVSKLENAEAWSTGPCEPSGTVMFTADILGPPQDIRTIAGSPFADAPVTIRPVGWLSGDRLVVASRQSGCDGPADLWIWSVVDGFHHIAHDALAPAVRVPRGPSKELPDVIEEAAPG